jgi:hypothetical protein
MQTATLQPAPATIGKRVTAPTATLTGRQMDQLRGAEHRHVALVLARGGGIMLRCRKCGRRVA